MFTLEEIQVKISRPTQMTNLSVITNKPVYTAQYSVCAHRTKLQPLVGVTSCRVV